ncbi:MAG: preprotein translocase subunit YajC [Gemmatimonadetes bacterium]|nr:preprotein translocase subunit YajC [Gemmatimonadota bacterium]
MLLIALMAAPQEGGGNPASMFIILGGFVAIMYFLLIRPQRKQQAQHAAMVAELKTGDVVSTMGGIKGKIVHATDDIVTVESGTARVEIERNRVQRVHA